MKHLVRDHLDVLQNIELVLVRIARQDPGFDDPTIDQALRHCIKRTEPPEDGDWKVGLLIKTLDAVRETQISVSDDIWIAALRKVDESVQLHSELRPGEKSYLQFVEEFVR